MEQGPAIGKPAIFRNFVPSFGVFGCIFAGFLNTCSKGIYADCSPFGRCKQMILL
jgi:hypothetical protein